ncbi:hypothetical protein JOQ06_001123 [Pogonophryne albipinna]|uniref:Uncharacterized protein n=1 Tax=Pogonophryne albipinna TaxID=1090488 RepID=A0AAD6FIT5_9TELE|nr:hypothetical protein JOQ06_001123 [Pogonophryne albipinna]
MSLPYQDRVPLQSVSWAEPLPGPSPPSPEPPDLLWPTSLVEISNGAGICFIFQLPPSITHSKTPSPRSTIDPGALADSVACDDEGEAGQLSGLETSELSPPDRNSSTCSSPKFPPSKRKRNIYSIVLDLEHNKTSSFICYQTNC